MSHPSETSVKDERIAAMAKGKVSIVIVRPATMSGLETEAQAISELEKEKKVAQLKIVRGTRRVSGRNEYVRGTAQVQ